MTAYQTRLSTGWGWACAVIILPSLPFILGYGVYGLALVIQPLLLLMLAGWLFRPHRMIRNFAIVGLVSIGNGAPLFLMWSGLGGWLPLSALLVPWMVLALAPIAIIETWMPKNWRAKAAS